MVEERREWCTCPDERRLWPPLPRFFFFLLLFFTFLKRLSHWEYESWPPVCSFGTSTSTSTPSMFIRVRKAGVTGLRMVSGEE